jgi:hypothetical protein
MSTNENLAAVVVDSNTPLKQMLLEYVGNKYTTPEDEGEFEVTVQMIVETLAHEFPEFVMIMAEENWVRGYQQGLNDATNYIQQRQKMLEEANNFYTASGIHVFTKDELVNELVDLEGVIGKLESMLPEHLRDGIEMVIVGQFDEFAKKRNKCFLQRWRPICFKFQTDNDDFLMILFTRQHTLWKSNMAWRYTQIKNKK